MTNYAKGIYFDIPDKKPAFLVGRISIHKAKLLEYLSTVEVNDKGYVKLDILESKESKYGKYSVTLNTWKPKEKYQGSSWQKADTTFPTEKPFINPETGGEVPF